MTTRKQLIMYGSTVFLISWVLQILAITTTGDVNSAQARPWLAATMLAPTLVTIFFLIKNKSWKTYLLWRPNARILQVCLVAVIVPTLTAFLILIMVQQFGYGKSNWFSFTSIGVDISGGPFLLGVGKQHWLTFIFNILITGIVYSIINGMVAAGEEFAWRGFFQQTLMEKFGKLKGIALLGFIWSMWHLPVQLAGYNFLGYEIIGSFVLSPLQMIGASFFFGWLTLSTKSFIPAAIAHGAVNSIQEGIISNIQLEVPMIYQHWIRTAVIVFIGLLFFLLLRKK
jgi:membrane protease YdiL (CAAX protease family)